jgi:hypothetical protein
MDGTALHYRIGYEYQVNEEPYWSDCVNYGFTGSNDGNFATAYVAKYPAGTQVVVYYDPLDPQRSVLEPDVKEYDSFLLAILFLIFEAFILVIGVAQKQRPTQRAPDVWESARFQALFLT